MQDFVDAAVDYGQTTLPTKVEYIIDEVDELTEETQKPGADEGQEDDDLRRCNSTRDVQSAQVEAKSYMTGPKKDLSINVNVAETKTSRLRNLRSSAKKGNVVQSTKNNSAAKSQFETVQPKTTTSKFSPFKAQAYQLKKTAAHNPNQSVNIDPKRDELAGYLAAHNDENDLFAKSFHEALNKTQKVSGLSELNDGPPSKKPSFMMPTKSSVVKGSIVPNVGVVSSNEAIKNFHNSIRGAGGKAGEKAALNTSNNISHNTSYHQKRESHGGSFHANATQVIKNIDIIDYDQDNAQLVGSSRGSRNMPFPPACRSSLGTTKQSHFNTKTSNAAEEVSPFPLA